MSLVGSRGLLGAKSAAAIFTGLVVAASGAQAGTFDGHWRSVACELRPQTASDGKIQPWYLKRDVVIKGDKLDAVFTTYADDLCHAPLWKLEFGATMTDTGESPALVGARKITLVVDRYTHVAPLAQGFADFLNSPGEGTCGASKAAVGMAQDIRSTGCKAFGLPPGTVVRELETMAVTHDMVFFAARPVDGSSPSSDEKRVNALQVPMERVQ